MAILHDIRPDSQTLSYADPADPLLKRWVIRGVEGLSGRRRYAKIYQRWRSQIVPTGEGVFGQLLAMSGIKLACSGSLSSAATDGQPLIVIANHPYGIGDGMALLSMVEQLGRPFRVLVHNGLLKVPEMKPYALPVDFADTKQARLNNMAMRNEALRLLKEGTVVVIFPAGGVATAPGGFGDAVDLDWKIFPAKLVSEAKATVIPVHFAGQNGRLFHLVSRPMNLADHRAAIVRAAATVSLTLRLSLLVREFRKLEGRTLTATVGRPIGWEELSHLKDRKALTERLKAAVFDLAPNLPTRRRRRLRLPVRPASPMMDMRQDA